MVSSTGKIQVKNNLIRFAHIIIVSVCFPKTIIVGLRWSMTTVVSA